jgi:hypothetical protein
MQNEQIHVKFEGDKEEQKILVIREGKELPLKEPNKIDIVGNPGSVFNWLEKRLSEIKEKTCIILVNKNAFTIDLVTDEKNFYRTEISSILQLSPEYISFKINSSETWECFKLADFIKMNRSFFVDKVAAMNLVTELRNFKSKVSSARDKFKDDRANYEFHKTQSVETNLPEAFSIRIPIFKGVAPITLLLEVCIDPDTLGCSLISPEAEDFKHEQSELIIESELTQIKEIAKDIAIIYQ